MKKVFAVLLTIALVMSLGMSVSAASSPEGVSYYKVYVIDGQGADTEVIKVPVGEDATITANADPSKGDFDKWMFYKADGSAAVEGKDYEIVSGTATGSPITIIPLCNLIVTANYGGKITEFDITNNEPTSPQTGDNTVVVLSSVMMLALAGVVVAKKQLAK
ncbi:MAG: hypothetical protein E7527_05105 [Ruminococcaceae bacterium]|nr:hypothetical protein [Oscillospiraceae bacterium]